MMLWVCLVLSVLIVLVYRCWYLYDLVSRLKRQLAERGCTVDCQAEGLEIMRAELKELRAPALYSRRSDEENEVPLGRITNKSIREIVRPGIANMVAVSQDLLMNRDAVYDFTAVIETSEGNWGRTIEPEGVKRAEIDHEAIFIQLQWNKICAGKHLVIEDAYIVHRGRKTKQYLDLVGMKLTSGDEINLGYTFSN